MPTDKKMDIVFWAFPSWKGDYMKSTVELAKELALHHRVLYIDYSYTIKDILSRSRSIPKAYILGKDNGLQKMSLTNGGSLYVLSLPPILPFNWIGNNTLYNAIEKINDRIVAPRVCNAIQVLNFDVSIAINAFNPFMGNATSKVFGNGPIIYYCYDNIAASNWASKHGARLEEQFAQRATAVIYSSEALRKNKHFSVPEHVVNNGVNLRNFLQQMADRKVPTDQKKVVGYVGTIDDRLDYEMLEQLIKVKPDFEFEFVGRIITDEYQRLSAYSNVNFLGSVDPTMLPGIMARFDAGIIPFVKNEFTKNIYPMKVNEYLALGMPVVSTDFASLSDLAAYMLIAEDTSAFISALETEIATDNKEKRDQRKAKAASNSWEQKAIEFENILMRYVVNS